MAFVARALVIVLACAAAAMSAGVLVTIAALHPTISSLTLDPIAETVVGTLFAFGAIFVSVFSLLPWALVVILAESYSIRALLFYGLAGAAVSALNYLHASDWSSLALTVDGFARRELEIMAAAGIVFGFVYWAIAGRRAGAWRETEVAQGAPP